MKYLTSILALLLLLPTSASAAIAINNASTFRIGAGAITVTPGSNLCTVAFIDAVSAAPNNPTIGGVSMTLAILYDPGILSRQYAIYYLCSSGGLPTGTPTMTSANFDAAQVATFSGVDQTTPMPTTAKGTTSASPNTANITVANTGSWLVGGGDMNGGSTTGVGGSWTTFSGNGTIWASSNGTVNAGARSVTMSFSSGSGFTLVGELKPASSAVPFSFWLMADF